MVFVCFLKTHTVETTKKPVVLVDLQGLVPRQDALLSQAPRLLMIDYLECFLLWQIAVLCLMYCDKPGLLERQKGEIFFHWDQERHSDGGVLLMRPRRVGERISMAEEDQAALEIKDY